MERLSGGPYSQFMSIGKVRYTARAHTIGGRDGASRSDDGRLDLTLSTPGRPGAGTNPEQLLAAAWSACFIGALRLAARRRKVALPAALAVDAEVDLCAEGAAAFLRARFDIRMPGLERDVAEAMVDAARLACPYFKATRGNIDVAVTVI